MIQIKRKRLVSHISIVLPDEKDSMTNVRSEGSFHADHRHDYELIKLRIFRFVYVHFKVFLLRHVLFAFGQIKFGSSRKVEHYFSDNLKT